MPTSARIAKSAIAIAILCGGICGLALAQAQQQTLHPQPLVASPPPQPKPIAPAPKLNAPTQLPKSLLPLNQNSGNSSSQQHPKMESVHAPSTGGKKLETDTLKPTTPLSTEFKNAPSGTGSQQRPTTETEQEPTKKLLPETIKANAPVSTLTKATIAPTSAPPSGGLTRQQLEDCENSNGASASCGQACIANPNLTFCLSLGSGLLNTVADEISRCTSSPSDPTCQFVCQTHPTLAFCPLAQTGGVLTAQQLSDCEASQGAGPLCGQACLNNSALPFCMVIVNQTFTTTSVQENCSNDPSGLPICQVACEKNPNFAFCAAPQ